MSYPSNWSDGISSADVEAAIEERQQQIEDEHRGTDYYLTRVSSDLARLIGPTSMALGIAKAEIRQVLVRVWNESRRVAKIHDALGVEPPA